MAAKLKKRALAEFQRSQTETLDPGDSSRAKKRPHLSLVIQQGSGNSSLQNGKLIPPSTSVELKSLTDREISEYLIKSLGKLSSMSIEDIKSIFFKLSTTASIKYQSPATRAQIYTFLSSVLNKTPKKANLYPVVRDLMDSWIKSLKSDQSHKVSASLLFLLTQVYKSYPKLVTSSSSVYELAKEKLSDTDVTVKSKALTLLGHTYVDKDSALELIGVYSKSPDPRVRSVSFETLLFMHRNRCPLNVDLYSGLNVALCDDYDQVRRNGLKLVSAIASTYPDHMLTENLRLADDAFAKICNAINDLDMHVRKLAATLIGENLHVSQSFLEQTLDKKLMSNMRLKKNAHEREASKVNAGEWSSGRNWADDAPKQELEADTINLMSSGSCGAFIHGLEDEFMAVRSASIDSLTKLSIKNPKLAVLALDFLVDMFNDEIEQVRIRAIDGLTQIAPHISLQLHQLEIILSALDDFSLVVRENLHVMLQATVIATKDGLQGAINKLLENLKKYPQDKRSIFETFKELGAKHAQLTLPLVTQLLEIHPFFDTAEPDVEDPAYLCILILVFNAAQYCPTLPPLLDQYTLRHRQYLADTYPHLVPESNKPEIHDEIEVSVKFLQNLLKNLETSRSRSVRDRIKIAEQVCSDLDRLASIEPELSSSVKFFKLYTECQSIFLKVLQNNFWNTGGTDSSSAIALESRILKICRLAVHLKNRFYVSNLQMRRKIDLLNLISLALKLFFIVRVSNKSALNASEGFLKELSSLTRSFEDEEDGTLKESEIQKLPFLYNILQNLNGEVERKPGKLSNILQPLLLDDPIEPINWKPEDIVSMSSAVIYEPVGNNEMPLKYTGGMVLAVPVDAEIHGVRDIANVRLSIKTPDQKTTLLTPRISEFFQKGPHSYRLLTNALMSHFVWSEAMHVEISISLDFNCSYGANKKKKSPQDEEMNVIHISEPVKVYVLPRAVKRGI